MLALNVYTLSREGSGGDIQTLPYLSKRIFAQNQNDILINFIPLREDLQAYVKDVTADRIALYFEYLPSGVSVGVNPNYELNIASLLKVPLVMAIYKEIEQGRLQKETTITLRKEYLDQKFGDLWKRGIGAPVTVEEALRLSITKSDNTASNALLSVLPVDALDKVADYLDIPKEKHGKFIVISPKNYTSILRSLYLSAFLNRESSNEILAIMTQTEAKNQLPAGVPEDIKIAHKIGVYTLDTSQNPTFSDCGIVFVPNRPYSLCMMSDVDEQKANEYMRAISEKVYKFVSTAESN